MSGRCNAVSGLQQSAMRAKHRLRRLIAQ